MRHDLLKQRVALVNQSCRALALAMGVTAVAEAGTRGYGRSWERQGDMK